MKGQSQENKLNKRDKEKRESRMVDLNPKIPVITLSLKVSETLIKSQGLLDGIKKKTTEPYAAYK